MLWKDFFYFSHRERQGILLLLVFIAGVFAGKWIFSPDKPQPIEGQEFTETTVQQPNPEPETPEQPAYTPLYPKREQTPTGNDASSRTEPKRTYYRTENEPAAHPQPARYPAAEKLAKGDVIELNGADTLALMRLPGVGPSFAKRITGYRNLLGGYHRIEQLQEVYGMYEELYTQIIPYLKIDPEKITRLPVNNASLDKLKAHPYLNFYQAKAIVELRKKKGSLTSVEDLQLLEEFTPDDWVRITPYLAF
ncbi:MAG: helix-hairpin-helix domain-containing protein [Dysgonamonadaceae bacterium]|jgi:DNA uptake protein ComE-like DNA-binding protein|nr:helix-hairpin-helix domain-containing protein [Dysgonamonadaceae bacterium]